MKRVLITVLLLVSLLAPVCAQMSRDQLLQRATDTLAELSRTPLSVHVDTSPYSRQPAIFDKIFLTWDQDAPYLFVNGVQLTMTEYNFQSTYYVDSVTNDIIASSHSYTMEMTVVDPEVAQSDIPTMDMWLHGEGGLYSTPLFSHISVEDFREAGDLENSKNIAQGFSAGIGLGLGGVGLSCLIAAPFAGEYGGGLLLAGVISTGLGGLGVYICNVVNNNLNERLAEVFGRMAAAADGQP